MKPFVPEIDIYLLFRYIRIRTISRWHNLVLSLSSLVFPVPGPAPVPFVMLRYRLQDTERSSKTVFSFFSACPSSPSNRPLTSFKPSSWKF